MTAHEAERSADLRRGPRAKRDALCCECGTLRTISAHYRHKLDMVHCPDPRDPEGMTARMAAHGYRIITREEAEEMGRRTVHARCAACRRLTRHACVPSAEEIRRLETCRQQGVLDRQRSRRRLTRLLAWLEDDGVVVRWKEYDDELWRDSDCHPMTLQQFRDEEGRTEFLIRLKEGADPSRLLAAVELAEYYIERPDEIGEWRPSKHGDGEWRALRGG